MKHFLIVFLLCIEVYTVAQPHPKTKELVDSVAAVMCHCLNNTFVGLDEEVKTLIDNAINDPENGQLSIQHYLAAVGEERAAEIINQFQKLGSIDSDLTVCFNESTQRFQNIGVELEGLSEQDQELIACEFESEEKTIALLMEGIGARNDCGFAYRFIKLGLELKQK